MNDPAKSSLPRWIRTLFLVIGVLSVIPFTMIWRKRVAMSREPRIHLFTDMDQNRALKPQAASRLFRDLRVMRPPVAHAVARGELFADEHYYRGLQGGEWADRLPKFPGGVAVDIDLMRRGQERYGIYCAPCHGLDGRGQGLVAKRASNLGEGTWSDPTDLVDFQPGQSEVDPEHPRNRPLGHLFNTITNGIRTMPAYGPQVSMENRWAIVAYVRALQRSQRTGIADVPPEILRELRAQPSVPIFACPDGDQCPALSDPPTRCDSCGRGV